MHAEDRRTRLIAFAVITIVFAISMTALIYWAINVATARISSRVTTHFVILNPLAFFRSAQAMLPSGILQKIG